MSSEKSKQELLQIYGAAIKQKFESYDDLSLFLHIKDKLKTSFDRVKGAWNQYKDNEIDLKGLITSGVVVMGEEFIDTFLDPAEKQELLTKAQRLPKEGPKTPQITPTSQETSEQEIEPSTPERPVVEDLDSLDLDIQIPSILFDEEEEGFELKEEPAKSIFSEQEKPKFTEFKPKPLPSAQPFKPAPLSSSKPSVKPLKPAVFSPQKPKIKPIPNKPKVKPLQKIEYVAPEKKVRSELDALHKVGQELNKVKLEPLKFDKVKDAELKSVNVGAQLPGTLLYDQFNTAKDLIYQKKYDLATKKLEEIRENAEFNDDDEAFDRAVDMMANISAYKMIPILLDAGDKMLNDPGKAAEKFNKALGFAKTLKDEHYIGKVKKRLNKLNQRVNLMLAKKDFEEKETQKLKDLLKKNILELSKNESLMSIAKIKKHCNAKDENFVIDTLVEMIQNKEVFAKFFPESRKVMFDKDANRDAIRLKIDL